MRLVRLGAVRTPRLRILALHPRDARALRLITADPTVLRAIHFLNAPFTLRDAGRLIRGGLHGVDRFYGVRRERRLIGVLGLGARGNALEVGYWFGRAFQGRGFGGEAVGAFVGRVRRQFPERPIIAECRPDNLRSWRLLRRLGFREASGGTRPGRALLRLR